MVTNPWKIMCKLSNKLSNVLKLRSKRYTWSELKLDPIETIKFLNLANFNSIIPFHHVNAFLGFVKFLKKRTKLPII